jgi:hypothetical protein
VVRSDDHITPHVAHVSVAHPAPFLHEGILIIDTPGTNATTQEHGMITRQVVESEADAAIIINPATVPISQSPAEFLAGPLRPYLHHCLLVVTRMDQIRPWEQGLLLAEWHEVTS